MTHIRTGLYYVAEHVFSSLAAVCHDIVITVPTEGWPLGQVELTLVEGMSANGIPRS